MKKIHIGGTGTLFKMYIFSHVLRKIHSGYPFQNVYFWLFFFKKIYRCFNLQKGHLCFKFIVRLSDRHEYSICEREKRFHDSNHLLSFMLQRSEEGSENRKTAEIDKWSQDLTPLRSSALQRATVEIWEYEKDEKSFPLAP